LLLGGCESQEEKATNAAQAFIEAVTLRAWSDVHAQLHSETRSRVAEGELEDLLEERFMGAHHVEYRQTEGPCSANDCPVLVDGGTSRGSSFEARIRLSEEGGSYRVTSLRYKNDVTPAAGGDVEEMALGAELF